MNALTPQTFQIDQILNIKQLTQITGLSRATIYAILDPKSKYHDETFPKQIYLSTNRVDWIAQEIHEWIQLKISQRAA
ncbi:helix-turn-helix transcriptional regulator [Acinetobacter haemolyticus]|uniref:helix-turn-helix transcriptional regulator n=1 Tax=Acinetobacter haemolyticus TaxID=29430 RepID=UPI0021CD5733|nr:AlpA family phage regulatory protein [Acinetobacter haemolyticus]MCU4379622.1 AlpA family phage regulatory protein [Acinetobacter haemolyticus]